MVEKSSSYGLSVIVATLIYPIGLVLYGSILTHQPPEWSSGAFIVMGMMGFFSLVVVAPCFLLASVTGKWLLQLTSTKEGGYTLKIILLYASLAYVFSVLAMALLPKLLFVENQTFTEALRISFERQSAALILATIGFGVSLSRFENKKSKILAP